MRILKRILASNEITIGDTAALPEANEFGFGGHCGAGLSNKFVFAVLINVVCS